MPQLDASQYAAFAQILEDLKSHVEDMDEVPQNFVSDQIARNNEYGARTFVSPKQMAWLERLHEQFVGTTQHQQPKGIDGRSPDDDDINDDIPF